MQQDSSSLETHDESYFASFTDLLVGVIFVFIILLMIFASNYQEAADAVKQKKNADMVAKINQAKLKALDEARTNNARNELQNIFFDDRKKVLNAIGQSLKNEGIPVVVNIQEGFLRLPEGLLFKADEDKIDDSAKKTMATLAGALGTYVPCISPTQDQARLIGCSQLNVFSKDSLDAIFIVDHPDPKASVANKWLHSVQRTVSVFSELTRYESYLDKELKNSAGVPVLNVTAHQERRQGQKAAQGGPVVNKSIELRFFMRQPNPVDIKKFRDAEDLQRAQDLQKGQELLHELGAVPATSPATPASIVPNP